MPIEIAFLFMVGLFVIAVGIVSFINVDGTKTHVGSSVATLVVGIVLVSFAVLGANESYNGQSLKTNVIYEMPSKVIPPK